MISTYADGYGTWHAVVPLSEEYPFDVAWNVIARELRDRYDIPRSTLDAGMRVRFVGVSDDGRNGIYVETWWDEED